MKVSKPYFQVRELIQQNQLGVASSDDDVLSLTQPIKGFVSASTDHSFMFDLQLSLVNGRMGFVRKFVLKESSLRSKNDKGSNHGNPIIKKIMVLTRGKSGKPRIT